MIVINYNDKRPIYEQIVERVKNLIYNGVLEQGDQLPSVRNLAVELSINPNTIQRAYVELEREGFIVSVKGRGNFVQTKNSLWDKRKEDILKDLRKKFKECAACNISLKEVEEELQRIYKEGPNHD